MFTPDGVMLGVEFFDPNRWRETLGPALLWVSLVVLFVECGLLFPFLPGDTLLFSLGLFIATGDVDLFPGGTAVELTIALVLMTLAAFLGNVTGYEIGRRAGPPLYERNSRFLRRKHFDKTRDFFDRHGPWALVGGRFVAFVRTFITVVAGATRMPRRRFFVWSAVGAGLWVLTITMLGYFLGASVPALGDNIDLAMLLIMAVFAVPLAWEWWHSRHQHREQPAPAGVPDDEQLTSVPDDDSR